MSDFCLFVAVPALAVYVVFTRVEVACLRRFVRREAWRTRDRLERLEAPGKPGAGWMVREQ